MLFKRLTLERIASGEITLAFRRWKRPTVSADSHLRTALGEVQIGSVRPAAEDELDYSAARRAGYASLEDLQKELRGGEDRALYRIEIKGITRDQREIQRENDIIGDEEFDALKRQFQRWDNASGISGHHLRILKAIAGEPCTAAARLAERLGIEKLKFKRDVRKLKEMGLTQSMKVGYRLSPRGVRLLHLLKGDRS